MQIYRRLRSDSPIVLRQSRIILWGSTLALMPFLIWVCLSTIYPTPFSPWLYMPSTILFPLSIAYAMLRYNQLNFDRLLTAGASYVIAGALVVLSYFGIAYLVSLVTGSSQTLFANPGLAALFVLLAVVLLDLPRQRLERAIERIVLRGRYDTQTLLRNYSRRLTEVSDLSSVVQALREQVFGYFQPVVLYVYLLDVRMNAFVAQPDPSMPRLPSTATNTYSTPKIHLNAKNGVLNIEGRSIPENPSSFYEPIASWISEFLKNPPKKTKIEIKLDYINSGSSKSILSLLKLVKKYSDNGVYVEINWYYEEDDESIRDLGKHYKSILKLPLNLIETIS